MEIKAYYIEKPLVRKWTVREIWAVMPNWVKVLYLDGENYYVGFGSKEEYEIWAGERILSQLEAMKENLK